MAIDLETLTNRLAADVPARDGIPSADQYERCVTDAVADWSRRNSMERYVTISVVSGTATYTLPTDFLRVIRLVALGGVSDTVVTGGGALIPVPAGFSESYTIAGQTITFVPTPTYTLERELWYAAGHVLDDDEYPYLTDDDVAVLMLLAQSKAIMLQANAASLQSYQYAFGDERVSKEKLADSLRAQAKELETQYREAATRAGGGQALGMRATYTATEQAEF